MGKFKYTGFFNGHRQNGLVTAVNESAALRKLAKQGVDIESIIANQTKGATRYRKPKQTDYRVAMLQLVTLLSSGVPLIESLETMSSAKYHPDISHKFTKLKVLVIKGNKFSSALKEAGLPFPDYVAQLARAGEYTGELSSALHDACERMEYEEQIQNEIKSALIYPIILILVGVFAVLFIFIMVVPKFTNLLEKSHELPFLAYSVLTAGKFFNENTTMLLTSIIIMSTSGIMALSNPKVRSVVYERAVKLPLIGTWLLSTEIAKWSGMLSVLLRNKVQLVDALKLSSSLIKSRSLSTHMIKLQKEVSEGTKLNVGMAQSVLFESTAIELVKAGERSGKLPQMLLALSKLYNDQSRNRMKKALTLIEPLAIILIGGFIGVIMAAVILAITSANQIGI